MFIGVLAGERDAFWQRCRQRMLRRGISPRRRLLCETGCSRRRFCLLHPSPLEQEAEPVITTLPLPQVAPKPTKRRVGQRAPERDPVGEASASVSRQTISCSFTEEIPVTLSQMEEAGVFRFECPICRATQTIKPKGNRVKFSWHPKRTTNTPNHGLRWVKQESRLWGLSQ